MTEISITPEQQKAIDLFDGFNIQHGFEQNGEMVALYKMKTISGDDCSEWIPFRQMVDILNLP